MTTAGCYTIAVTIQGEPIVEQMQRELAHVGFPVPTTALRALVGSYSGKALPAERLGRILGYERQRFLMHRGAPRIAVALTPDAKPARPQHLTDGDWRFGRRILTYDARPGQAAALGAHLCRRAQEAPQACDLLWPHVQDAAWAAFGSMPTSDSDWPHLYPRFLQAQPHSIGSLTGEQRDAEKALEGHRITGLVKYFGSDDAVVTATALSTIRAPMAGERGEALDDLVRKRAGNSATAREVLAFIQEWGHVADDLNRDGVDRSTRIEDYIQRWGVSEREAQERLHLFWQVFPNEQDPSALWRLLWDMVPTVDGNGVASGPTFVRLISQPVIVESEPPTLAAYFLASLYDQLPRSFGSRLRSAELGPRAEPQDPRRDLRRLYRLAQRVMHRWVVMALEAEGPAAEASLLGLKSLEPIEDDEAAAVAEQAIGGYRQMAAGRTTRAVLLSAQKCLRVCADSSLLDPSGAATPLLPGARHAAGALAALCALEVCDLVKETSATLETLYATA